MGPLARAGRRAVQPGVADVYEALAYCQGNPEEMTRVDERPRRAAEEAQERSSLTPPENRLMAYRLVLDEDVEYKVHHRLGDYGNGVEHVDFVASLGKGAGYNPKAQFLLETNRVIVTYDDDSVFEVGEEDYRAVLYFGDPTQSIQQVAEIIHSVSQQYPKERFHGLEYVDAEWF